MLTVTDFAKAGQLVALIFIDAITYSDLGPLDRALVDAYHIEEDAHWAAIEEAAQREAWFHPEHLSYLDALCENSNA